MIAAACRWHVISPHCLELRYFTTDFCSFLYYRVIAHPLRATLCHLPGNTAAPARLSAHVAQYPRLAHGAPALVPRLFQNDCTHVNCIAVFVMCGIGALLQPHAECGAELAMSDAHLHLLARRGPDVQRSLQIPLQPHNAGTEATLTLHGSVLSMRGTSPLAQPLVSGRYLPVYACHWHVLYVSCMQSRVCTSLIC